MSLINLYNDYGIETAPEGHKHYREGWINTECPHCSGSQGYHLGFNTDSGYFYCWRCEGHSIPATIAKLLNVSFRQAKHILESYNIKAGHKKLNSDRHIKIGQKPFKFPSGVGELTASQKKYLIGRMFDPDLMQERYGVQGTSAFSQLDFINYKYRILIPIKWQGQVVSFQCRDVTDRQKVKYMACPEQREILHHKHILYLPHPVNRIGICVEGVMDVWRLGVPAFCTFGIGYTVEQVRVISELFDEVFVLFDPEPQAQQKAKKLVEELRFRGVKAYNYTGISCDPADLPQEDANYLVQELVTAREQKLQRLIS